MRIKGRVVIISGPSGVGKGSVIKGVLEASKTLQLAVSATTRAPRPGEVDGEHYFFLSPKIFDLKIEQDEFVEWCDVHQNKYGTLKSEVLQQTEKGKNILLEIDTQGTLKAKKVLPNPLCIFIAPPKIEELRHRLAKRNTDLDIDVRLSKVDEEMSTMDVYDYVVINDDLDLAIKDTLEILEKELA